MTDQEIIDTPSTELTRAVDEARLPQKAADDLLATFQPFFDAAYPIARQATGLVITDATQLTEMKAAREARLKLKSIRVEAEKARKGAKEDALRTGQAIDRVAGVVRTVCEEAEAHLLEQETFAERAEQARRTRLASERTAKLQPYLTVGVGVEHYDLAGMPEPAFDGLLDSLCRAHEDRIREAEAARQKAEDERKAREAEDRRIREENARLAREKAEAEARERAEREAREKVELELAAKRAAEEKAEKARFAAEKRAAQAPDAEKLRAFAAQIGGVVIPAMTTVEGRAAMAKAAATIKRAAQEINALATALE